MSSYVEINAKNDTIIFFTYMLGNPSFTCDSDVVLRYLFFIYPYLVKIRLLDISKNNNV